MASDRAAVAVDMAVDSIAECKNLQGARIKPGSLYLAETPVPCAGIFGIANRFPYRTCRNAALTTLDLLWHNQ